MSSASVDEHDEDYESESHSSPLRPSDEQEQALLNEHDVEKLPQPRAREALGLIAWLIRPRILLPIIIGTVLAFVALAIALKDVYASNASVPVTVPSGDLNDYILNPKWDPASTPRRREYTWKIQDAEKNPDGVFRPLILINGQFPGPLIECNEGDTIVVNIDNQAMNATSIHWHGLYQNGTNHMDGTVGITQCPIAPKSQFTYEFKVEGQSGTYWYHAHQGVQAADGLVGPLIIHGKNERELQKIGYETDRVVMVQDFYYDLSSELLVRYLAPDQENSEPVPDSALINGKNIRDCSSIPHRKCDNSSAGLQIINLEPTKNHRLRIINVGAFAEFQLQIDEHEFAVTEVDGTDIYPAYYHRLKINPAQRYSIVISSNTTKPYWLRAQMVTTCFAEPNPDMKGEARAIINYGEPLTFPAPSSSEPMSKDWTETVELECRDMDTSELIPVEAIPPPAYADTLFDLRTTFQIGAWRLSRGFFNETSWRADVRSPSLLRAVDGLSTSNVSFTTPSKSESISNSRAFTNTAAFESKRELILQTYSVRTIDLLVSNFDDGAHPLHLHGHKFWILASGSSGYPPENLYNNSSLINLENPLRRDTATLEAFGWVLIRVTLDNPGMWALHCHVTWHAEAGLMMAVLARSEEVAKFEIPAGVKELCTRDGLEKGMAPEDKVYMHNED